MIGFVERKLVNGASLRTSTGQMVAIHLNVTNGERYDRTISGKTTDDIEVRVELAEPLNVAVNGWIQVIGTAKSPNGIQGKEVRSGLQVLADGIGLMRSFRIFKLQIILFPDEEGQQPFDKKATNDMITFYNNCSNIMD